MEISAAEPMKDDRITRTREAITILIAHPSLVSVVFQALSSFSEHKAAATLDMLTMVHLEEAQMLLLETYLDTSLSGEFSVLISSVYQKLCSY